ncbi:MAG: DUF2975 domain-containing protein [Marinibacterium sp.]
MPPHMHRLIGALQALTLAAIIALPVVLLWATLSPDVWQSILPPGVSAAQPATAQRLGLLAVSLLPAAALLWALVTIWRLFGRYRQGVIFGVECSRYIRRTGQALLMFAVLRLIAYPAQVVLLTAGNAPGERSLAVSISHADLGLVLGGGLLLVIGWVMGQAAQLAEDNAGFV